jgi:hypothetical protein
MTVALSVGSTSPQVAGGRSSEQGGQSWGQREAVAARWLGRVTCLRVLFQLSVLRLRNAVVTVGCRRASLGDRAGVNVRFGDFSML